MLIMLIKKSMKMIISLNNVFLVKKFLNKGVLAKIAKINITIVLTFKT